MKNKKGIAFLTTVMILGIIVLMCAGLSVVILRDAYTIKRIRYATQAYFLAEAGAEEAIQVLYDSNFVDTSTYPRDDVALGAGTYDVDLTSNPTGELVLIRSTGTVRGQSRTVEVTVRDNTIEAFDYPVLCGGRMYVGIGSSVFGGDIRSNNHNMDWSVGNAGWADEDVYAGGKLWNLWGATINGDAYAASITNWGTINGSQYGAQPDVELPPFDADFFDFYRDMAQSGGFYFAGSQTFGSLTYTPPNGVIFVNGKATINGNTTINGCLVATGQILVNLSFPSSTFTQNQVGNLPALMTKGGNIDIYSPANINGLVYTNNEISAFSFPWGTVDINGAVIGKGGIYLYPTTRVDFVRQNPPGLSDDEAPLYIEYWSG